MSVSHPDSQPPKLKCQNKNLQCK
uniref:Uncharacterized protein n=1 Tax=Anguilla anguilla TaxID=7936 RepID=A0A0E9XG89_ANGAN